MNWFLDIFFAPGHVVYSILFVLWYTINGKPEKEVDFNNSPLYKLIKYGSILFWFWLGLSVYENVAYDKIFYVYACPSTNISKCHKVVGDYTPEECEETEYDNRGAHGGGCTDDSFSAINFSNTNYINFDYCTKTEKDRWTCYAEKSEDGTWDLQLAEIVKVKK